jgi:NADPH-dependent glutamate synthase beta subunit-like oxidoreductase
MAVEGRTHKPVIDKEKCQTCSVCFKGCPAEAMPELRLETNSLRGRVYKNVTRAPTFNVGKEFDMPPCQLTCPVHQDVRRYVNLIAQKKYTEALEVIRDANPLPSVCGYVCHHPCELECVRNLVDEPVSIKTLKRFVLDIDNGRTTPPEITVRKSEKISIVGSGPAGLAAAYDLLRLGYAVEIFEAANEPGGMLRWAIPPFRLPRDILDRDINYIKKIGAEINVGKKLGTDITVAGLKKKSAAVILALGTQEGLKLGLENEQADGYIDCLDFLKSYAGGERINLGAKSVIIGGGNAAMDAARSALRCGAKEANIIYRRSQEEMPADHEEVEDALSEGVKINYLVMPLRITKKGTKTQVLECQKTCLGEPDESGRRKPIPVEGSEFQMEASSIIAAVGQRPELSWNNEKLPFKFTRSNTFAGNSSGTTGVEGVFAAGDNLTGPSTVVEAMAGGKAAAKAVDVYLSGRGKS